MGDITTLNNIHNLTVQEFLSESVYNYVDSVYLLNTKFQGSTYHLISDGRIKVVQHLTLLPIIYYSGSPIRSQLIFMQDI